MDYRNFSLRVIISFLLLFLYLFIILYSTKLLLYLVTLIYLGIVFEIIFYLKKLKIFIITYILFSFLFFIYYFFYQFDLINFNYFILTIISFDIFSYIIGKLFGRKKILKYISPNKTYEGFIGGFLFANLFALFFQFYFYQIFSYEKFLFANILIFSSFFGDLIESFFKRKNNLKNSSNIFPGHGGFFDRFDSFILCNFFLVIFNSLIL